MGISSNIKAQLADDVTITWELGGFISDFPPAR